MNKFIPILLASITLLSFISIQAKDIVFPDRENFFFGVSNAPSQVEDQLDDIWMQFARNGKIPAFDNVAVPEERIRFWTNPEVEIKLARELGTEVFRLGVDWQRLMSGPGKFDYQALQRYKEIIQMIKANNMKVMLSLFHHTEPFYTHQKGSWRNQEMIADFREFWQPVLQELAPDIDYLVTFNEAQLYVLMTQVAGMWPYPKKPSSLGLFNAGPFRGVFEKSLRNIAKSHGEIYDFCKEKQYPFLVGIAHNMADYTGKSLVSKVGAFVSWQKFNYRLTDLIAKKNRLFWY